MTEEPTRLEQAKRSALDKYLGTNATIEELEKKVITKSNKQSYDTFIKAFEAYNAKNQEKLELTPISLRAFINDTQYLSKNPEARSAVSGFVKVLHEAYLDINQDEASDFPEYTIARWPELYGDDRENLGYGSDSGNYSDITNLNQVLVNWYLQSDISFFDKAGCTKENFFKICSNEAFAADDLLAYWQKVIPESVVKKDKLAGFVRSHTKQRDRGNGGKAIIDINTSLLNAAETQSAQQTRAIEDLAEYSQEKIPASTLIDKIMEIYVLTNRDVGRLQIATNIGAATEINPAYLMGFAPIKNKSLINDYAQRIAGALASDKPERYEVIHNVAERHFSALFNNRLEFSESHKPNIMSLGYMLRAYRKYASLTQEELADFSGYSHDNINNWESGGKPDNPRQVWGKLTEALNKNGVPDCKLFEIWEAEKRATINQAMKDKDLGGLLKAYREYANLTLELLADLSGHSHDNISYWESRGKPNNPRETWEKLTAALEKNGVPECQLFKIWEAEKRAAIDQAINDKNLGGLLKAYREYASLTQQELADSTGYSEENISHWESGVEPNNPREVWGKLTEALGKDGVPDCKLFKIWETEKRAAIVQAINDKNLGGLLKAYREYASLTQQELADSTGYSEENISHWESGGKPNNPREVWEKLTEALNKNGAPECQLFKIWEAEKRAAINQAINDKNLGGLLKTYREYIGLTQEKLANLVECSRSYIRNYENAFSISDRVLIKIETVLNDCFDKIRADKFIDSIFAAAQSGEDKNTTLTAINKALKSDPLVNWDKNDLREKIAKFRKFEAAVNGLDETDKSALSPHINNNGVKQSQLREIAKLSNNKMGMVR